MLKVTSSMLAIAPKPNYYETCCREQIQDALDAGENQEWHLVGVSDVLPARCVILFWDTSRPSFGRSSR
jgi:predicted TPR repeat methyltransferase